MVELKSVVDELDIVARPECLADGQGVIELAASLGERQPCSEVLVPLPADTDTEVESATDNTSIVDAVFANTTGRRSAASRMLVVKRTRSVTAVRWAMTVNGSSQWPSGPVGCRPPAIPPWLGSA